VVEMVVEQDRQVVHIKAVLVVQVLLLLKNLEVVFQHQAVGICDKFIDKLKQTSGCK